MIPPDGSSPRLGWWVGLVHALLVLSWTAYVLFLPSFAAKVGLPAAAVVWIILLDQALFVVCDWASGVFSDRIAALWRRLGPAIVVAALASGALFSALPWVAGQGSPGWLLAFIVGWAVLSSFLRAPVLAMLGRIGGANRQGRAVAIALGGIGLASAAGPFLTDWLRQRDPLGPFVLASATLALASLMAIRADAWPMPARPADVAETRRAPVLWIAAVLLLAGLGFQWHTALLAGRSPLPWARVAWMPLFWGGFVLGLLVSMRLATGARRLQGAALAMLAGALASQLALRTGAEPVFALAQPVAGMAWAVAMHTGLGVALARSPLQRLATPVGLVFSALALAALCRVLTVALQAQTWAGWSLLPAAAWLAAAWGFWRHPWRGR